jgi:hypothetical protein
MSPEQQQEIAELRAFGVELAGASQEDLQPRCIARAFARPEASILVLTMQGWIDLDAIGSPILLGLAPEGKEAPEQIQAALVAFDQPDFDPTLIEPSEAIAIVTRMLAAVRLAFSTCLRMREPGASLGSASTDGFGTWLPTYTRLIVDCHLNRAEAMATPVVEAFALIATSLRNKGWCEAGEPYSMREVE